MLLVEYIQARDYLCLEMLCVSLVAYAVNLSIGTSEVLLKVQPYHKPLIGGYSLEGTVKEAKSGSCRAPKAPACSRNYI